MQWQFEPLPAHVAQRLQSLRIIAAALIVGVVIFAVIVVVMPPLASQMPPETLMMLRVACIAVFVSGLIAAFVIRGATRSRLKAMEPPASEHALLNTFQSTAIISLAVLEGPALLACVVTMLSHQPLDLLLGLPPLLLMIWQFPTEGRWRAFANSVQH